MTNALSVAQRGVQWTTLSTLFRALLFVLQLAVASRFLNATALGIFALVQLTVMFFQLLMDLGVGQSVIHQQRTRRRHLNALGFMCFCVALGLAVGVYLLAPLVAFLFSSPGLVEPLRVAALVFVFSGWSRMNLAVLQKHMRFGAIASAEFMAVFISVMCSILLLLMGHGVYALIAGIVMNQGLLALFLWLFSGRKWFFSLPDNWTELRRYWHFGLYQSGANVVNFFNSQVDVILVGKLLGTEILGGYHLVRQLCFKPAMLINPVVTRVAYPYMAKMREHTDLATTYAMIVKLLSWVNFSLYAAMAVFAEPLIAVFFGPAWLHVTGLMQILAVWCLLRSAQNPVGALLMAVGKVRRSLWWNVALLLLFPASIAVGTQWGVIGVATALAATQFVAYFGHWWWLLFKTVGLSAGQYSLALARPASAALLCAACAVVLMRAFAIESPLWILLLGAVVWGLSWLVCIVIFEPQAARWLRLRIGS
ncbi:MOP flippase family protein [Aestuariibacter halophilus]|uniref:MOP flippase family protein n=1 Tax=Fluctibacter halophilus TaxID=226011 RepID=A0ABS8G2L0_9ALTE|nr:MOP flippase family protein [Aestuariibacter halophilus]MCC2614819.1 MOP flippase family protein [Aestuariibacter halophilus]